MDLTSTVMDRNSLTKSSRKRKLTNFDEIKTFDGTSDSVRVSPCSFPQQSNKGPQFGQHPLHSLNSSINLPVKDFEDRIINNPHESDLVKVNHSFVEKESLEHSISPEKKPTEIEDGPSNRSLNVVPKIIDKLWDGPIQLNASVTVSVVAFFKSGEKASKVKWPELVEVKGKVRLDAFEKFIQELPRSRNRALMVISLCWKVGSSNIGLTGMKEVATSYKKGKRVGYAQLSPGTDIYVCPRSDTIITILAKHGFFKGKAVVEDDLDSLIGCIVWRKNRISSISPAKRSEKKKALPLMGESVKSSSSSQAVLSAKDSEGSPVTLKSDVTSVAQVSECLKKYPPKDDSFFSNASGEPSTPLAPDKTQINLVELPKFCLGSERDPRHILKVGISADTGVVLSNPTLLQPSVPQVHECTKKDSPKDHSSVGNASGEPTTLVVSHKFQHNLVELPAASKLGLGSERDPRHTLNVGISANTGLVLSDPILSRPSQYLPKPLERITRTDFDDLPEFDFSIACGLSQPPTGKLGLFNEKACNSDPIRNVGGHIPQVLPIQRSLPIINPNQSHTTCFQGPVLSPRPDSHIVRRNIWDDDDNIPEWHPPDLTCRMIRPPQVTNGPHNRCPLPVTAERIPPSPQSTTHVLSSSYQTQPQVRPFTALVKLGQMHFPEYSKSNPAFRPPSSMFDMGSATRPFGWRGRRY